MHPYYAAETRHVTPPQSILDLEADGPAWSLERGTVL